MQPASAEFYPFIEVSLACTDVDEMEKFWVDMFDGKVIFRGKMMGQRFSRIIVCGVTLAFREDPDMPVPPGPGQEFHFRNHLGLRVTDLEAAIARLEGRGAKFAMTPAMVRQFQQGYRPRQPGSQQGCRTGLFQISCQQQTVVALTNIKSD